MHAPETIELDGREWTICALNRFDVDSRYWPVIQFAELSARAAMLAPVENDPLAQYKEHAARIAADHAARGQAMADDIECQRAILTKGVAELREGARTLDELSETTISTLLSRVLLKTWGGTIDAAREVAEAARSFRGEPMVSSGDEDVSAEREEAVGDVLPAGERVDA